MMELEPRYTSNKYVAKPGSLSLIFINKKACQRNADRLSFSYYSNFDHLTIFLPLMMYT